MTMTIPGLILLIVIAASCGAIGRALAGGARGGLIVSTALGFIGALIGPWIGGQLGIAEPVVVQLSGRPFPIVWSIVGAALFVSLSKMDRPKTRADIPTYVLIPSFIISELKTAR